MSSGLVHASNTMRAGALKVRVMTTSRSDFRSTVVSFFIGGSLSSCVHRFLLLFQFLDHLVELVEARAPQLAIAVDPRRDLVEPALAERARPHAADLRRRDEPGMLQHADVLLHAGERHVEPLGEVRDRRIRPPELLQHAAPRGIRQRGERGVERAAEC